jgi:heat-inducible transcriptional repressor
MKVDDISPERLQIEQLNITGNIYDGASALLSGLSSCVGVVIAPKMNKSIRKIEFLKLEPYKILGILMTQDGMVENRVISVESDITKSELEQVSNFLNERISGKTLPELNDDLLSEVKTHKNSLNIIASLLVNDGIIHPLSSADEGHIFISGQGKLLDDPEAQMRLAEMKSLFVMLEEKQAMLGMMNAIEHGEGVQIFIGSENPVFERPAWSTIIRAYHDKNGRIIGATGVIGPTRLNYGKIVPIVDYTSLVVEKLLGKASSY